MGKREFPDSAYHRGCQLDLLAYGQGPTKLKKTNIYTEIPFNTFAATDELSRQLMFIVRCH